MSALLATWLDAARAGRVSPDDFADAVRGDDPRHLVTGRVSLALPAPGDLVGLGGPASFNTAATDAGEAVVAGAFGLVPVVDARTVVWRAHPADPARWVDERETAAELKLALADVTRRLVDLDVAAWQPDIPDLLLNLRHRAPLPLPPGYDARRVETVERAVLCLDILDLAGAGEGGAVTAYEMQHRRAALDDLARATRRALVGACSSHGE